MTMFLLRMKRKHQERSVNSFFMTNLKIKRNQWKVNQIPKNSTKTFLQYSKFLSWIMTLSASIIKEMRTRRHSGSKVLKGISEVTGAKL